ncbi:DUF6924 domain-containing protein [Prosthecobacter sp.]|uniref:DUF6924 domain-containing protein n=1 Tax=Prosthecobacter sp. TaxID=1965333 RepID=UPI003784E42B
MKPLPDAKDPIVLRTDFSDDDAWSRLCALISSPIGRDGFEAHVVFVDDASFANVTPEALCVSNSGKQGHSFIVLADARTFSEREQSLLVMDLRDEPGRTFRALPTRIQAIENNLSIANMDFAEFADAAEGDTFRGFPGENKETYEVSSAPRPPVRKKPSPPKTLLGRALIYSYKMLRGRPRA